MGRHAHRSLHLCALVLGTLSLSACAAGCSTTHHETDGTAHRGVFEVEQSIELLTWWGRLGESNPIGSIVELHRARHPSDTIREPKTMFFPEMDKMLATRMAQNDPPDIFQINAGASHKRWLLRDGRYLSSSQLLPLDGQLPEAKELRMMILPDILKHVVFENRLYAVPATIHRINTLYFNKRVFREHQLQPPHTLAELFQAGEVLRNSGIPLIAFGARDPWMFSWIIWESLLIAQEGADFYDDYFSGKLAADDPRMLRTLETGLRLLNDFGNKNWRDVSWIQAAAQVREGAAATVVTGDWTTAYFSHRGLHDDDPTIGELPFPGSADTFVFTSDVFVLPIAAKNRKGAIRLLSTIASPKTQAELAIEKGCLSPRGDVTANLTSRVQKEKDRTLRTGRLVLAASGKIPTFFIEELLPAFSLMLEQNDIEPVVLRLRSRYCLLKAPPSKTQ